MPSDCSNNFSVATKTWPWLYQKTGRGINSWRVTICPSSETTGAVDIITESGLVDPRDKNESKRRKVDYKLTKSTTTITHGKNIGKANETSAWEQAYSEAQKKHKTYIERGYSTDVHDAPSSRSVLLPMLAHAYEKRGKDISFPAICQHKLDGIRVMAHIDSDGYAKLLSRTGKELHNFCKLRRDVKLVIEDSGASNIVLDGELYTSAMSFEELSGLCRLKAMTSEPSKMQDIELHIFDCYDMDNPEMSFLKRFSLVSPQGAIRKVSTWTIERSEQVDSALDQCIADGYEGLILRNDAKYDLNTRSVNLQKLKRFYDKEYEITGFSEAKGNDKGTIVFECTTEDGKQFSVRPEGSRVQRQRYLEDFDKLRGKMLTVKYQELTKCGVPRFPVGVAIRDYE